MLRTYFERLYPGSRQDFYTLADKALLQRQRLLVVTANPETLMIGEREPAFDAMLCDPHTVIVPDGIGVVRAAKKLTGRSTGRIAGVELAEHLLGTVGSGGMRVYLYGAREEVVSALAEQLRARYGDGTVVGYHNGYGADEEALLEEIRALCPDLLLVALGVPRQELLLHRWYDKLDRGVMVGVGGTFDVLSGKKKRAPKVFLKLNCEWLYRIVKEPKRFKRFYNSNVKFISRVRRLKKQMR